MGETYEGVHQLGIDRLDVRLVGLKQGLLLSGFVRFAREAGSCIIIIRLAKLLGPNTDMVSIVAVVVGRAESALTSER